MPTYYCKKCNFSLGEGYHNKHNYYYTESKKYSLIHFLDCGNCNNFIGIQCFKVCRYCFGKYVIYDEEKLIKWLNEYKKTIILNQMCSGSCKKCNMHNFRTQHWFFKELTFTK